MNDFLNFECKSQEMGFSYIHSTVLDDAFSVAHVDRDLFSVVMLLDGELDYVIEGKPIHIHPKDVLLVGNNELHHTIMQKECKCEYILLMINLDFFIKNNCTDFTDMVFNRALGCDNIISADKVTESGVDDIFRRLSKYMQEQPVCMTVVRSVLVELLYNLNKQVMKNVKSNYKQEKIRHIISYINEHLADDLSLEHIAEEFFFSRQYLCKIFKENTGFSVYKYISYKRIVLAKELYSKGMSLSEACRCAGFNDYSAFYRAYTKIMGESPQKNLS